MISDLYCSRMSFQSESVKNTYIQHGTSSQREERIKSPAIEVVFTMPEYVDPQVETLRGSESSTEVTLLLGISGDHDTVIEQVEQANATVDDTLGRATLRVTVPEAAVDSLCDLEGVKSIELEREDVRVLSEGNSHSRPRVTR
jgi:hypothetical protein